MGIVDAQGFQRVTGLYGITRKEGDVRKEISLNSLDEGRQVSAYRPAGHEKRQ